MTNTQIIPIKSFIQELDGSDYKALYFDALTNGRFIIQIFDVNMWPEGLAFNETPVHEKYFDNFISAYNHLTSFTSDFFERINNRNLDPLELITEYMISQSEVPSESEMAEIKKEIADEKLREKHESDMSSLQYEIHMEDERDTW